MPPTSTTAWEQYFNRELRSIPVPRTQVNKATTSLLTLRTSLRVRCAAPGGIMHDIRRPVGEAGREGEDICLWRRTKPSCEESSRKGGT